MSIVPSDLTAPAPAPAPASPPPAWQGFVVGGIALVLAVAIIASLMFISRNMDILADVIQSNRAGNPQFAWASMGVLGQVSLRILAVYFGAAAMLAGTATAFYSTSDKTTLSGDGKQAGVSFALATASPGIAAVVAGGVVICIAVTSHVHASYSGELGAPLVTPTSAMSDFPTASEVLAKSVAAPAAATGEK